MWSVDLTPVAVVEDDPSMRRSILRLLNAHGFAVEDFLLPRRSSVAIRTVVWPASCSTSIFQACPASNCGAG